MVGVKWSDHVAVTKALVTKIRKCGGRTHQCRIFSRYVLKYEHRGPVSRVLFVRFHYLPITHGASEQLTKYGG